MKEIFHLLVHSPGGSQKPDLDQTEAWGSIQFSHVGKGLLSWYNNRELDEF